MSAASNEQTCRNLDVALDGIRKADAGLLKLAEAANPNWLRGANGGRAIEESKRRHAEKIENRRAGRQLASQDGD
jgi:hypothetical protein